MKKGSNIVLMIIICFFMHSAILNTLKINNAPSRMNIFAWIPILIALVVTFRYFAKKFR